MNDVPAIDLAELRAWIGRTDTASDVVTPRLIQELNAALDKDLQKPDAGDSVHTIHWCLAPVAAQTSMLGADGHPARGGFLPPIPLPRRMWAGGQVKLKDQLRAGDQVKRLTRITDVTIKEGRTGVLCFVTLDQEVTTNRGTAILERQDIVYSGIAKPASSGNPAPLPEAQWREDSGASSVLLFRYSALTFNGHRIHYDRPYATEVEFYPGLVVHGPLQATLLVEFGARIKSARPLSFKFRGVRPLYDFMPFQLCAHEIENGLHLWIETKDGIQTMDMEAFW